MTRIFVDTDELRTLATALRADSTEIGEINLQLVRAWSQAMPPPPDLAWLSVECGWVLAQMVAMAGDVFAGGNILDLQALENELGEGAWSGVLSDAFRGLDPSSMSVTAHGWREWLPWGVAAAASVGSTVGWLRNELDGLTQHSWAKSGSTAWWEQTQKFGSHRDGGSASLAVGELTGRANANAKLSAGGLALSAGVAGSADLVHAHAELHAGQTHGPLTTTENASVDAQVGAQADAGAKLDIGRKGLAASADAGGFAGASASAKEQLGAKLAGGTVKMGADGGVEVGIGAKASADATVTAGHVHVKAELNACFGIGAHVGVNIDLQMPKVHLW
jgi:hypothetical protein